VDKWFSAVAIRDDMCTSCIHMIRGARSEPKCKIFTFENEKHGVPHLDKIALNYANYCEYFVHVTAGVPKTAAELGNVPLDRFEGGGNVEERVTLLREIAYPDTKAAQHDIRKALTSYLDDGWNIMVVELIKVETVSRQSRKVSKKEKIRLFVKKVQDQSDSVEGD